MSDQPFISLESLTREQFAPEVGTVFEIPFEDGSALSLELKEVRDIFAGGNREDKRQAFALTFLGGADKYARQGTYPLVHPRLGHLSFFIVPLGPDPQHGGRMRYEAIFT